MTKSEAQTVGRVISAVSKLSTQVQDLKRESAQTRRAIVDMVAINRRLVAEKATLMESVAILTLRAQGLPINCSTNR